MSSKEWSLSRKVWWRNWPINAKAWQKSSRTRPINTSKCDTLYLIFNLLLSFGSFSHVNLDLIFLVLHCTRHTLAKLIDVNEKKIRIFRKISLLFLQNIRTTSRACKKHVRFQDGKFCESQIGKIRRLNDDSPSVSENYQVGGTSLCADYARKVLLEAAKIASNGDRKTCKYSDNYPTPMRSVKMFPRFTSVCI